MNILYIGDIVGRPGRKMVAHHLLHLRKQKSVDVVVANAENASGGKGLTPAHFQDLLHAGVDVITLGDHVWDKKEIIPVLAQTDFLLRPANYPPLAPGKGAVVLSFQRQPIAFLILQGRVFMNPPIDCPFQTAERLLPELKKHTPVILVEIHCETTSEKMAMAWFLNGAVSAVVGTHTHVPTSDARILSGGTAYITDIGMTGPADSVIGMEPEDIIQRYRTGVFRPFRTAKTGNAVLNAVLISVDPASGKSLSIEHISLFSSLENLGHSDEIPGD
ncbi:MAG: TIGR00282 family metallophosphoesterase [bacterium JZ-2024 1]